jgi:hypothetical protein
MAGRLDFTGRPPVEAIMQAIINKPGLEQDMALKDEKNKRDRVTSILDAVKTGQEIAGNMMEYATKREALNQTKENFANQQAQLMANQKLANSFVPPAPTASSFALGERGQFPVAPSPEQQAQAQQGEGMKQLVLSDPKAAASGLWDIKQEEAKSALPDRATAGEFETIRKIFPDKSIRTVVVE